MVLVIVGYIFLLCVDPVTLGLDGGLPPIRIDETETVPLWLQPPVDCLGGFLDWGPDSIKVLGSHQLVPPHCSLWLLKWNLLISSSLRFTITSSTGMPWLLGRILWSMILL